MSEAQDRQEGRAGGEPHDLDGALERARHELPEPELEQVIEHAEVAADRAASRQLGHWAVGLLVGALIVAAVVHDNRFLLLAILLATFYALPYVIAGISTAWSEGERSDLSSSLHEHEHERRAQGPERPAPPAPGPRRGTAPTPSSRS